MGSYIMSIKKPTNSRYPENTNLDTECVQGYTSTAGRYGYHDATCHNGEWDDIFALCVADDQGKCTFLQLKYT